MRECRETRKLDRLLRADGAMVLPVVASAMTVPGWPDRYIAHRRWSGWIEFKGPRTRVTDLQRLILRRLHERGARAYVVRFTNPGMQLEMYGGQVVAKTDRQTADALLRMVEEP